MLFNKLANGQDELKALLGFLYASNNFDNIKTDIELVEEDMIKLIGQPVYDLASTHYHSVNFNTGGDYLLLDNLVYHIQLPVAYYAWYNFSQHLDVTHAEDGRKVVLDKDNESMAWEWMLHRDDDATLNKAHKTTDRLIAFLEENENDLIGTSSNINLVGQGCEKDAFPGFFHSLLGFVYEESAKKLTDVLEWDSDKSYYKTDDVGNELREGNFYNCFVKYESKYYYSSSDDNLDNTPDTDDGSNWRELDSNFKVFKKYSEAEHEVYVWKESDSQKDARSLFINTASDFDAIFPIDESRRFFIKIIPFIKEVEKKHIFSALGKIKYDEMKAAILDGSINDDQNANYESWQFLLPLITVPIAYLTLSLAVKRLSFSLMPNGIFQDYESQVQKAKQPVAASLKRDIAKMLEDDGFRELEALQKEITKMTTEEAGETYEPADMTERIDPDEKYIRL